MSDVQPSGITANHAEGAPNGYAHLAMQDREIIGGQNRQPPATPPKIRAGATRPKIKGPHGGTREGAGRPRRTDIKVGDQFGSFSVIAIAFDRCTRYQLKCWCGAVCSRDGTDIISRARHTCTACSKAVHLKWGSFLRCGRHQAHCARTAVIAEVTCDACRVGALDVDTFAYGIHRVVRGSARKRGIAFELSVADILDVRVGRRCTFCDGDIGGSPGIDRISSRLGYVLGNVQPACGPCNSAKGILEDDEFRAAMAVRLAKRAPGHAWDRVINDGERDA